MSKSKTNAMNTTAESISLDKTEQKAFKRKTKAIKKNLKSAKGAKLPKPTRGLVYIAHIPHGFYEVEIKKYFSQFGKVTNVKVCRSNRSAKSKGYGYVEFLHEEVAKIAASTMNNYLMFKRKIVAEFVEKRPQNLFRAAHEPGQPTPTEVRRQRDAATKNREVDETAYLKESKTRCTRLQKRLDRLRNLDIDYDLKPVDVPQLK